jgi:hypothetical protein
VRHKTFFFVAHMFSSSAVAVLLLLLFYSMFVTKLFTRVQILNVKFV